MDLAEGETDLRIITDRPADKNFIRSRVRKYRGDIERYITRDRRFSTALKPLAVELEAPVIVKDMSRAARKANVGPMAAVAGAIAKFLGKDLLRRGYKEVIIENGGDIFLKIRKATTVGIYSGGSNLTGLSLRISPKDTPLGVCTSSGTVGHSLSFGLADAVVILAKDASLADAAATAAANRVKSQSDLYLAADFTRSVSGVLGAVIIIKNSMASWGKVKFLP